MPFKTFTNWLFDERKDSDIPSDITKYNSPITHTFVISLFLRNGNINKFLNKYLNNIGLRYVSKQDLFRFVKKVIQESHMKKYDLMYYQRSGKNQLFDKLREKLPVLKDDDISLLTEQITSSSDSVSIYESLGLQAPKKRKFKKQKRGTDHISSKDFLRKNFEVVKLSGY